MIDGKKLLGIIPAREGSKRLPGKNILSMNEKPLIAWTIEAAQKSLFIDRLIVSTDSFDIADVSEAHGADVPFMRPPHLSSDTASSIDMVLHSLAELEKDDEVFDYVILLQPTSPLRTKNDIDCAVNLLRQKQALGVISVCRNYHHPYWSNQLPPDGSMADFIPNRVKSLRSQDLPDFYQLNGAIYLFSVDHIIKNHSLAPCDGVFAYKMTKQASIDIDDYYDFVLAEFFLKKSDI